MRLLLAILIFLSSFQAAFAARERMFVDEAEPDAPDSIKDPDLWKEKRGALPPWPSDSDLVEFELDTASPFRYFIDQKSLRIGTDKVVRYTLIAESRSGRGRNVSFEGLRCEPQGVFQIYAYGVGDRFEEMPGSEWQSIRAARSDKLHRELHEHFLCIPMAFEPRPEKDMIRAMRGTFRPGENSGFLTE